MGTIERKFSYIGYYAISGRKGELDWCKRMKDLLLFLLIGVTLVSNLS